MDAAIFIFDALELFFTLGPIGFIILLAIGLAILFYLTKDKKY